MRDDPTLLLDILGEVKFLIELTKEIEYAAFVNDPIKRRATERSFSIIGEASRKISKSFKDNHPNIPWRWLGDTRNFVVHAYHDIDYSILWETIRLDIPNLIRQLEPLIPKQ